MKRNKTIRIVFFVLLSAAWIFITTFKLGPFGSLGKLTTYKTGLLSVPLQSDGTQKIHSDQKLDIYVDNVGIPHIYSATKSAAAYGLGYMHAKDRYFQMEMVSRIVQGRLSEFLWSGALKSDKFWKPYEFEKKSEEILQTYKKENPEFYAYLQSYSDGVNAYLENNENTDPFYKALGATPRKWKTEYSLLFTWYMSYTLTYFDHHIDQQEIFEKLPGKEITYFYPLKPAGINTILPSNLVPSSVNAPHLEVHSSGTASSEITQKESSLFDLGAKLMTNNKFYQGVGSNNWVVNNTKTKSKNNILANDPHLYLTLPEAFYEAHMVTGAFKTYGFTIPGVPVVVSGHNDKISWGITNGEWDLVDRYKLQVKNDSLYLYEGKWIPFKVKNYTIKVKGKPDYIEKYRSTVQGKVIKEENGQYYAQHWYAAEKSNSVKAMYEVMKSQNWDGFSTALKGYSYPPQNFAYSDVENNIGIVCAGELPARSADYVGQVLDGTKKYIPTKPLNAFWSAFNPDKGFLFSANQQPIQNNVYFGAHGSKDDYRAKRIYSVLEGKKDWSVPEIQKMQSDVVDISLDDFKTLTNNYPVKEKYSSIVKELKNWDGDMSGDGNQGLVFEMLRKATIEEAKQFAKTKLQVKQEPSLQNFLKYLNDKKYTVPGGGNKQKIVDAIFERTLDTLTQSYGDQWKKVTYKNMSKFSINNILFVPGLGEKIDNVGGNINTININTDKFHPVFRAVYEVKDGNIQAHTILAGGQSGLINSIHYKDQIESWRKGKYKKSQFVTNPAKLEKIINTIKFN
ncbi:penicillin acylase family protein [Flavobacterium collinsii]|uniref:Acyl-homoserine lactone acylase QuiP n=1 Tax=Flavobacterium collinsii TaxID=1114861 RepID=A0A9W4X9W1_9FLAO|nr:penicillin acylase family protein [Flavobacterium collinsii]GIQ60996.1 penicillin amidase [Flavobacterium collinsii]CAI2767087.1 Acyl-homoserine lactone acylase QuiP [Flavobacterium collinsii]